MKFMGRESDEGLYVYAAVSAAVITSVYLFYKLVWEKQRQPIPTPTPMPLVLTDGTESQNKLIRTRNPIDMFREP